MGCGPRAIRARIDRSTILCLLLTPILVRSFARTEYDSKQAHLPCIVRAGTGTNVDRQASRLLAVRPLDREPAWLDLSWSGLRVGGVRRCSWGYTRVSAVEGDTLSAASHVWPVLSFPACPREPDPRREFSCPGFPSLAAQQGQGTVCSSPGLNAGVSQTGGSDEHGSHLDSGREKVASRNTPAFAGVALRHF